MGVVHRYENGVELGIPTGVAQTQQQPSHHHHGHTKTTPLLEEVAHLLWGDVSRVPGFVERSTVGKVDEAGDENKQMGDDADGDDRGATPLTKTLAQDPEQGAA